MQGSVSLTIIPSTIKETPAVYVKPTPSAPAAKTRELSGGAIQLFAETRELIAELIIEV